MTMTPNKKHPEYPDHRPKPFFVSMYDRKGSADILRKWGGMKRSDLRDFSGFPSVIRNSATNRKRINVRSCSNPNTGSEKFPGPHREKPLRNFSNGRGWPKPVMPCFMI